MRPVVLVREVVLSALASRVPTTMLLLIVGAMVTATLTTVGRTAAAEEALTTDSMPRDPDS